MYENVGAFPRDSMDRRLFSFLPTNTPALPLVDSLDHYHDAYILDFNPANPPSPLTDSDNDGMPDYWETSHGLNNVIQDHNGTGLSNSITGINDYTNLECYINCLSDYLVSGQTSFACGITGVASIQAISMYDEYLYVCPNPFSTYTTLETDKIFKDATLTVYNSFGQCVKQIKNISGQTITLHRDNLPSGQYFIQLTQDSKVVAVNKLIITDRQQH